MTDTPVIVGRTLTLSEEQYAIPEIRQRSEELVHEMLRQADLTTPIEDGHWRYDPASTWDDPDTGETLALPARHIFILEGIRP